MEPLAVKLRPNHIDDVIGQKHLLGENKVIRNMVNNNRLFSMILYGKPGIGKTSIANALVNELDFPYKELNAVINNKVDFDIAIEEAKMQGAREEQNKRIKCEFCKCTFDSYLDKCPNCGAPPERKN